MDRQQDPSGDYGYDLVHEAARRPDSRETPAHPVDETRRPAGDRPDSGGDLEYDEAHDF